MKRVVIADDSATARLFTRRCLEIAGLREAEFVEAADGEEALARLREAVTDLLVTDLTMPRIDGTGLLRRIAASPTLHGLPILVITSADTPAKARELTELGARAVLGKPINPAVLAQALETIEAVDTDADAGADAEGWA